jgi:hypothetical protein
VNDYICIKGHGYKNIAAGDRKLYSHCTKDEALREAKRLALTLGDVVIVYAPVAVVTPPPKPEPKVDEIAPGTMFDTMPF